MSRKVDLVFDDDRLTENQILILVCLLYLYEGVDVCFSLAYYSVVIRSKNIAAFFDVAAISISPVRLKCIVCERSISFKVSSASVVKEAIGFFQRHKGCVL